ncbi:MAG: HAMP domain-containing histidine kinase [Arenicella sp.]|nr:HAMP domain-containing histidine kinase [Arenicella sp.]
MKESSVQLEPSGLLEFVKQIFRRTKNLTSSSLPIFMAVSILISELVFLGFYLYLELWKRDHSYGFYIAFIIPLIISYFSGKQHIAVNNTLARNLSRLKIHSGRSEQLLSILAHDVRSPVSSLFMLTEMLENDSLPLDEVKELARDINQRSNDTLIVIDNLLSWLQSQTTSLQANIEELDMTELILTEVQGQRTSANLKSIDLNFHNITNSLPFGDRGMVSAIIRNILNNAIKFTDVGGKVIVELSNKKYCCLVTISDTGSEAHKATLPAASDEPISEFGTLSEKGFGLGLKLCREYALKSKGVLELSHNDIGGVTATLELPLQSV